MKNDTELMGSYGREFGWKYNNVSHSAPSNSNGENFNEKMEDVKNIVARCIVDVIGIIVMINNAMEWDVLQGNTGQW